MAGFCSWCKRELSYDSHDADISQYYICSDCRRAAESGFDIPILDYINAMELPVLVINEDGTVKTANFSALSVLEKSHGEIENRKGGEVFRCRYSDLPGGCGGTVHCVDCTIRMLVMDTFSTGNGHFETTASLESGHGVISFKVSTVKSGSFVLLRIDKII